MRNEAGSILTLTAIVLLGLLTFAGLAIDAGNLYRAQLAAQNAADTAALAVVNFINMRGKVAVELLAAGGATPPVAPAARESNVTTFLRSYAIELARANMASSGFPDIENTVYISNIDGVYQMGTPKTNKGAPAFRYTVTVRRPIPHLLMDKIPFVSTKFSEVFAIATSDRKVANVAVMLDLSGSLGCPATGVCNCLSEGNCPDSGRKFDALVDGVRTFISFFDLEADNISFVAYNLGARTLSMETLRGFVGASDPVTVEDINNIAEYVRTTWIPAGPTNICDAILEASADMERVAPGQTASYVLFSDGAPTAGRFLFSADAAKPELEESSLGYGTHDYSMYTVDWLRPEGSFAPGESRTFAGPSLLIESGALLSASPDAIGAYFADPASPERPDPRPMCNDGLTQSPKVTDPSQIPAAVNTVLSPCLSSMKSHMPGDPARTYGADYGSGNAAKSDWRRQFYHCAVELSDYLRETRNATFYSLGLGARPAGAAANDPYENIDDTSNRKDILLARIALDLQESNNRAETGAGGTIIRQRFDYNDYKDYSELSAETNRQKGLYLPTPDPNQLRLMFQQIARKVLLRLVR